MRLSLIRMGQHFGELAKIRGVTYFYLSPFEQKAFTGIFKKGIPNTVRRVAENFWRIVPSFVVSWLIISYYESIAAKMKRKDPEKYACDV